MKPIPIFFLLSGAFFLPHTNLCASASLTLEQVLQRMVDGYSPLRTAELQVERARQEIVRVESQLGWVIGGKAQASHDVSFFGTPSDRLDTGVNGQHRLASGATLGVGGSYVYEDSSFTIPGLPNPSHSMNLDLSYRLPLGQGAGNPDYAQGLVSAQAGVKIAQANVMALRHRFAQQAIDLYFAAALTQVRIDSARQGVTRAQRLKQYIQKNSRMGLSENKDKLQAEAQLQARIAEQQALLVPWEQQRSRLNRLMNRPRNEEFAIAIGVPSPLTTDLQTMLLEAENYSPEILNYQARLALAEAALIRSRNAGKDVLDLILSTGSRSKIGPVTNANDINEHELAAVVSVEYRRSIDRRGFDATVYQMQLDRSTALQEIAISKENLRYDLPRLRAGIEATRNALAGFRRRLQSEQEKFKEAEQRYQTGRTDTARLIQFETELYLTELAVERQRIDLTHKYALLQLVRGKLWDIITPAKPSESPNESKAAR